MTYRIIYHLSGWRDAVLNHVLEGSRQPEYEGAVMACVIGAASSILSLISGMNGGFTLVRLSVLSISIILFALGALHTYALIKGSRRLRLICSKYLVLVWIFRGAGSALSGYPNPIFVLVVIFISFFAVKSAIAYLHNEIMTNETAKKEDLIVKENGL